MPSDLKTRINILLIDSHCHLDHLDLSPYNNSLDHLLASSRDAGVKRFLCVGIDMKSSKKILEITADHDDIDISVGLHPLQDGTPAVPSIEDLVSLASNSRVVAIGETGLDNYYGQESNDWQINSFITHLKAGDRLKKPVIVHTRAAQNETIKILRNYANTECGGVLHCFTETPKMAFDAIDLNFYISFSGIITFKNANTLRETVKEIPLERILIETDSPWLAPVPFRGSKNEPKYVLEVAKALAKIKGVTLQEVCEKTAHNYSELFL